MLLGNWKNIAELEENLSLDELEAILRAAREAEHRRNKFAAALKGVDIDKDAGNAKFDEIKKRVEARRRGKTVEELDLNNMGIAVVKE